MWEGVHPPRWGQEALGCRMALRQPERAGRPPATVGAMGSQPSPAPICPTTDLCHTARVSLAFMALAQMTRNNPCVLISVWRMEVYIKQLLIGSSDSLPSRLFISLCWQISPDNYCL
jgi:hypothetical protein